MKHFNVNWLTVKPQMMTAEEINAFLDRTGITMTKPEKGCKLITSGTKIRNKFFRAKDTIMGYHSSCGFFKLIRTANEDVETSAYDAWEAIEKAFMEEYGVSLAKAFKPRNHFAEYAAVKTCVPSPINWSNRVWASRELKCVKKADVSSAYPAELSKRVPTWEKCMVVDGEVEPSSDYPFAFYSNRHIKVLEEDGTVISTYELAKSQYYMTSKTKKNGDKEIDRFLDKKPEKTILCRAAKYSFEPIMRRFYDNRKEHPEYKQFMNLAIGMFHRNKSPQYSNIAAVVLLRCSLNMVRRIEYLKSHKCIPLLVNTDSISWLGDDISLTSNTKYMGAFYLEYNDCEMYIVSPKCYQVRYNNETMTYWAGKKGLAGMNVPFGEIDNSTDFTEGYFWDDEKERYVLKGVYLF